MNDIFWISEADRNPQVSLAIVLRPRGGDWLEHELIRIKRNGVGTLVSLLEVDEAEALGLSEESPLSEKVGLVFLSYQIPDRQTPSDTVGFRKFMAALANRLQAREKIGVHCRGCIGRATITAACALIHLGWKPAAALTAIEKARGCSVPDTEEQRDWILRYKAQP